MNNCYPKAVFNLLARIPGNRLHAFLLSLSLAVSHAAIASTTVADTPPEATTDATILEVTTNAAALKPHTAVYHSNTNGVSADLEQTLESLPDHRWRLKNHSSVLFVDFDSSAEFLVDGNRVRSLQYDVDNSVSKKRSVKLRFDWSKGTVFDQQHDFGPLPMGDKLWDKLSIQAQLRLDLMARDTPLQEQIYPQISLHKIKQYVISEQGEETIQTPLGQFETIKLVEYREGKSDHTNIWVARDWDYLIVRLQRVEDGEVAYQIDLKSAELDGRKVLGK